MKQVRVIFPSSGLYDVVAALRAIPSMPLFTMSDVRGFPGYSGNRPSERPSPAEIDSAEMIEVKCVVAEALVPRVIESLASVARPRHGDDFHIYLGDAEALVIGAGVGREIAD